MENKPVKKVTWGRGGGTGEGDMTGGGGGDGLKAASGRWRSISSGGSGL